jgi:hypothetical protein
METYIYQIPSYLRREAWTKHRYVKSLGLKEILCILILRIAQVTYTIAKDYYII